MTTFSPDRVCPHNNRMVYLDDDGYNAEGGIMEKKPVEGSSYEYLVGGFGFGRLLKLLAIPFVMGSLRIAGLGECDVGPLDPKDDEVTEVHPRYAGFRDGDPVDSCLLYTTRFFS